MNIITNMLPSSVKVGDSEIPIDTSFRVSICVQQVLDTIEDAGLLHGAIFAYYFGSEQNFDNDFLRAHASEFLTSAMAFARADDLAKATRSPKGSHVRTFDWDVDQRRVVADFERYYSIDLTSADCDMHWWRFLALFEELPEDGATMTAIGYRALDIPKGIAKEEARRLQKLKRHYELPSRTKAEALARDEAIWGE
jgi:hypothetical protein